MEFLKPKKRRRISVLLTNLWLIAIVLSFEYLRWVDNNIVARIAGLVFLLAFVWGFIVTYVQPGLWRFIHKPVKYLDEREIALTGKTVRRAYNIFSVIVLSILFLFALSDLAFDVVMVVAFIIFAHMLPASIIAWTEKGDPDEE